MKNAFVDGAGVLVAYGYMESNNTDQRVEVDEEFEQVIGRTKFDGSKWVAFEPLAPVPAVVTMRQARLALLAAGKLAGVSAAIAGLPADQEDAAQIEWDYSAVVERDSAIVRLLGPALGLNDAALDALFQAAAAL